MPFQWGKKQNFKNNEHIIIFNFESGETYAGTIKGKSEIGVVDSYIVELSQKSKASLLTKNVDCLIRCTVNAGPLDWDANYECIVIPETCLKRPGE